MLRNDTYVKRKEFNMKSYADLDQSKKLAKILPHESADMWYCNSDPHKITVGKWKNNKHDEDDVPCWSLAALFSVLPMIDFTPPQLVGTPKTLYRCMYDDNLKSHACDNPVDACVKMILKLKEKDLL
jgi:hypothetical protein